MKKLVALLGLLVTANLVCGQPPAAPAAPTPAAPGKPPEKEEPPIPGIVIARSTGKGDQLGLTIVDGTFRLTFYDKKRKKIPVDVDVARGWWQGKQRVIRDQVNMTVMSDGKSMGGGGPVHPPYAFVLHLSLIKGSGDSEVAVENYTVNIDAEGLAKNPPKS